MSLEQRLAELQSQIPQPARRTRKLVDVRARRTPEQRRLDALKRERDTLLTQRENTNRIMAQPFLDALTDMAQELPGKLQVLRVRSREYFDADDRSKRMFTVRTNQGAIDRLADSIDAARREIMGAFRTVSAEGLQARIDFWRERIGTLNVLQMREVDVSRTMLANLEEGARRDGIADIFGGRLMALETKIQKLKGRK